MAITAVQYQSMRLAFRIMLSVEGVGPTDGDVLAFSKQLFSDSSGATPLSVGRNFLATEVLRTVLSAATSPTDSDVSEFLMQLATDSGSATPMGLTTRYRQMRNALRAAMSGGVLNPSDADVLSYFGSYGFSGNLASAFTPSNTLFSIQPDLGLTYGGTMLDGGGIGPVVTITGALSLGIPIPIWLKCTLAGALGIWTYAVYYDDTGTTPAMTGTSSASAIVLTGAGTGLTLNLAAGVAVLNNIWKATCAGLADQTGNGNNFTQAIAAKQPLIINGPYGGVALKFDGIDDSLQSSIVIPAPGTTPFWAYWLGREDAWTLNTALFGSPAAEFTMRILDFGSAPYLSLNQSNSTNGNSPSAGAAPPIGTYARLMAGWTNSAADYIQYGTGPGVTAAGAGNSGNTGLQIGSQFGTAQAGASTFLGLVGLKAKPSIAQFRAADAIASYKYASQVAVSLVPSGTAFAYALAGYASAVASWFADTAPGHFGTAGSSPNQYYTKDRYSRVRVMLPGSSTALTVEAVSLSSGGNDTVGVWTTADPSGLTGWSYNQTITFTSYGLRQQIAINVPAGTHCVDLSEYAFVTGVSAASYGIAPVAALSSRCVVYGDSIPDGTAAIPPFTGYAQQFKYAGKFSSTNLFTLAGSSLFSDTAGGTAYTATAQSIVDRLADASTRVCYVEKGTNDYGLDLCSAATFQTIYGGLIDAVRAIDPTITFVCASLFHRATETAQATHLSTWADFNTAIAAAVTARSGFCRLIDGSQAWTQPQIAGAGDGLHPNNALMTQAYNWLLTNF